MHGDACDISFFDVFAVFPQVVHAQNSSPGMRVPKREFMGFFYNSVKLNTFLGGVVLTDCFTVGAHTFRNMH